MTNGHTASTLNRMAARVTLSFSDDTIADARHFAERNGVSLSAWIDEAAQEKALRQLFDAHAEAVRRAGFDEFAALADECEGHMIDTALSGPSGPAGAEGSGAA